MGVKCFPFLVMTVVVSMFCFVFMLSNACYSGDLKGPVHLMCVIHTAAEQS